MLLMRRCYALTSAGALRPQRSAQSHAQRIGAPMGAAWRSTASFEALGVHDNLVAALREMGVTSPTRIQAKSLPAVLAQQDVLCTAQTGTGKTLAYMVPVVERLHRSESAAAAAAMAATHAAASSSSLASSMAAVASASSPVTRAPSRPQVLVLLPSRELALQVGDVAKQLAHTVKFASAVVTAGERKSIQQKSLARPLDLVVGTPGRVAKCIAKGELLVSRLTTVVLDEADTLLDAKMGFRKELDEVLGAVQGSARKRQRALQLVLVAATMRSPLDQVVRKRFGNLTLVSDDKVHQTPTGLQEEFLRVSPENKPSALRAALHEHAEEREVGPNQTRNPTKTVVFCRNAASCRATDHMLREHGFVSRCLHGEMPAALRAASVTAFQDQDRDQGVHILVCTDLAARGLHFDRVQHVVMCDFPRSAVDYVHRAGRTGRAGQRGRVTSLVTKGDVTLARTIQEAKQNRRAVKELRLDGDEIVEQTSDERFALRQGRGTGGGGDGGDEEEEAGAAQGVHWDQPRRPGPPMGAGTKQRRPSIRGHGTKRLRPHKVRSFRPASK